MTLPAVTPSSRDFDPGDEYIATQQWRSGGSTRRHYGEEIEGASLSLGFQNIDDAIAGQFASEHEALGTFLPVTLPPDFVAGMAQGLQDAIAALGPWFFADPPQIRSVRPGVSTVQVVFTADVMGSDPVGGGTGDPDPIFCVTPAPEPPPAPPEPPAP